MLKNKLLQLIMFMILIVVIFCGCSNCGCSNAEDSKKVNNIVEHSQNEIKNQNESVEEEPEVMANGDFDWSEYIDEEELKRQEYDSRSIDEILEEFEEEFNREIDRIFEEAFYESLDPYEQFVYGLQYSLGSYVDSVYNQYYGNSDSKASEIYNELDLDDYFTDLYDYENIVTEDDLIHSVENSRFRNVCDKTIGESIYGNLEDIQCFVKENPIDPDTTLITYTGIDKESDLKFTITFEVFSTMGIGVHSVYCNNRCVGGMEDVIEAVEYVLR